MFLYCIAHRQPEYISLNFKDFLMISEYIITCASSFFFFLFFFREVVGSYSAELRKLSLWLLGLICEGLGLECGYFRDEFSQVQLMAINHYPPCPDPFLTLGLPKHSDLNLITLLLQGEVHGLQVFEDRQWLAVEPLPNAFVVNIGHMLQLHPYFSC